MIHKLVQELRRLLESGSQLEAMELFAVLHPVDQGEILGSLPKDFSQRLLDDLNTAVLAEILEYLEPEESADLIGNRESLELAEVLYLTDPHVAVDLLLSLIHI